MNAHVLARVRFLQALAALPPEADQALLCAAYLDVLTELVECHAIRHDPERKGEYERRKASAWAYAYAVLGKELPHD